MILRLYLTLGLVLLGGTAWFIVVKQPPTVQGVPAVPAIVRLQEEGVIPKGDIPENEDIEHDVFVTPPEDEKRLEEAEAAMGSMPGMNMGATMDGGMQMDKTESAKAEAPDGSAMNMKMDEGSSSAAAGMKMEGETASAPAGGMAMPPVMDEEEAARAMAQQMAGLVIAPDGPFDREITLSMSEWTFSPTDIAVKEGERIRFTVRNDGKLLHEFMFMTMPQMQAITYRARRADWSLFEHEALYEKSLLLPGQEISFVATITKSGSWMFMCMLPYHMQMGMMGQLATPGAAMKM